MTRHLWDFLRFRKRKRQQHLNLLDIPSSDKDFSKDPQFHGLNHKSHSNESTPKDKALFAFVDLKDPFVASEIADEELPGPILTILAARPFNYIFMFHTPHTVQQAEATRRAIIKRFPRCVITTKLLPVSDPADYASLTRTVARYIRTFVPDSGGLREDFVCISSGTAAMRASWFLLNAWGVLHADLLQVRSTSVSRFGSFQVKEVHIDPSSWFALRTMVMPQLRGYPTSNNSSSESADLDSRGSASNIPTGASLPSDPKNEVPTDSLYTPEMFGEKSGRIVSRKSTQSSESASIILKDPADFIPTQLRSLDDALLELNLHVGSAHLRYAAEQSAIAAESTLPILLTGETGTGKERFAQLIHRLSPRASKYIVPVNCAAIPESLAETYLFGHTKGAFSGATADKPGLFENADGSTLFLDEIAELSLDIQAKLLRVIQDGVIQRIGGPRSRQVDVRIIAATNRNLKKEVEEKRFREDLYFRLEVVQIRLPALRDRRAEIPELALNLLKQINQRRQNPRQLSKDALLALEDFPWPGNVRQLSNVLERSVLYSHSEVLEPGDLLLHDGSDHRQPSTFLPEPALGFSIENFLDEARKQLFLSALKKCNNNQAEAAALLSVSKQAVSKFVASLDDNHD